MGNSHTALYRKYRSKSLDEIVGQGHITSLLKAAISSGKTSHAYLLTGPRGVGKTSIARIIAHEINGLDYSDDSQHLDIIEIDAASNNGVEDVRELREKVHIAPTSSPKKVYIIDEVHMLSKPAFNALLKTLEEPPEHVVFIMATTDADKLPPTIVSRVQRFNFRTISVADIVSHLRTIADSESIAIDDDALQLIANAGSGSFRDSISLLDQLQHISSAGNIRRSDVEQALGYVNDDAINTLVEAIHASDIAKLAELIGSLEAAGAQPGIIADQLITQLRSSITTHPGDIELLDTLLDVAGSSHPYIKLLAVLALHSPARATAVAPTKQSNLQRFPPASKTASAPIVTTSAETTPPSTPKPKKEKTQTSLGDFSWQKLIDSTNGDVALKSLLAKCNHSVTGDMITIFAASKFNASKLKSSRQLPKLHDALERAGYANYQIEISELAKPPSDSQLADVAAIMGGGIEVELDNGE